MDTEYESLLANYQLANEQLSAFLLAAYDTLTDKQYAALYARYMELAVPKDEPFFGAR